MNRKRVFFAWVMAAAFGVHSQPLRCVLIDSTITVNGQIDQQCLDIDGLNGTTVVVPSNVSELDNSGFTLCRKNVVKGGDADIVFILDQSGSMFANDAWINTGVNPHDTIYYQSTGGCSSAATSGNVVIPVVEIPRTVPKLNSGTGCNQYAGDPLNARAAAVRQAIDSIAATSSTSTAGYLGFGTSIGQLQRPVQLNSPANIALAKSNVVIANLSGTTYRDPLDSARHWLDTAYHRGYRKTSKAAIIFISDGSNNGPAYLSVVDPTIPIYGIFLGLNPTPDTANLVQLGTLTGGAYYRVPPSRPDSLSRVIKSILNRILQQYDPDVVTVTNSTIVPPQTSLANVEDQFLDQGNASWQIILDSAVGLLPNVSNAISVIARFKEATTGATQSDTSRFNLSTTGAVVAGNTHIPGTSLISECYAPTELRWLNASGTRPAFFTEADTVTNLQLRGPNDGLVTVYPALTTRRNAGRTPDAETATLNFAYGSADSSRFFGMVNMKVAATATPNSGVLEPFFTDSVIARWVNPRDARDSARDTMLVRPGNKLASAYFSTDSLGANPTSSFPATATQAWIVIVDNRSFPPCGPYRVVISDTVSGFDHETFTLIERTPGLFSVRIPLTAGVKVNNNGTLEFSPAGDQMLALYVDPCYGDSALAVAGIGATPQEPASLAFTDANGIALPNGAFWPLDRGKVYLRYTDDNAVPRIASIPVQLVARSLKLGQLVTQDVEQPVLADSVSLTQTLKAWSGNMNVVENLAATRNDNVLEGAYRIEVTATAQAHDNTGQPTGQLVSANLIIAWPDTTAYHNFSDSVNSADPEGPTVLYDTLFDQDFVRNAGDTLVATAICAASGDSVSGLRYPEISPGHHVSEPLIRNGLAANPGDRILSCPAGGDVVISYTDAVYLTNTRWTIHETQTPIANPPGLTFVSQAAISLVDSTPGAQIDSTLDGSLPRPGPPYYSGNPFNIYATTVLKAVASKPGYLRSWVMTEHYARSPLPSSIRILDANGNPLPNRTATDAATSLRISVNTSQGNLGFATAGIRSLNREDVENTFLGNTSFDGQVHNFWSNISLVSGAPAAIIGNDTLETSLPDTLIAVWRNPLDSSDVVADTAFVAPAYAASSVYFSGSLGGAPRDSFPTGTTTVYVVDSTRSFPGYVYKVTVSSSLGGSDTETYTMTPVAGRPGIFSVAVPVQAGAVKTVGDGSIQVASGGDQLRAMFIQPFFGDTAYCVAGYGQAPEQIAFLRFLDTLGQPLAPGVFYSPANDSVRVSYTDDWSPAINNLGNVNPKMLTFILNARRGSATLAEDSETTTIAYDPRSNVWKGGFPLRDGLLRSHDDTLESQFRGELLASVVSHTNTGAAGPIEQAGLVIAYPDQTADLNLTDSRDSAVTRLTDSLFITLTDQPFTRIPGARVPVRVSCLYSGDEEDSVWLTGDGLGTYTLFSHLPKDETSGSFVQNDGRLACLENDEVEVDYTDPVYGTTATTSSTWGTPHSIKLRFASASDSSTIASISDTAARFLAIVETASPTRNLRDTLWVHFITGQGESDSVPAVETGVTSGVFVASVPFKFTLAPPVPGDGQIEAQLNPSVATTSVPVTGSVKHGVDSTQAVITLFSQFNPAQRGYARDGNGDGQADSLFLVFAKKLREIPSRLDSLYWNSEIEADRRSVDVSNITISPDSLRLAINLAGNPFPRYLTGPPRTGKPAVAILPQDAYFGGQAILLADSVGPVPVAATKLPSDLFTYSVGDEIRYDPDTLMIKISEPLALATWTGPFRFRSGVNCLDPGAIRNSISVPILGGEARRIDDTTYKVIVDNGQDVVIPQVGDCIFLENDGRFKDTSGNVPGVLGVALVGGASQSSIHLMTGYPPVSGLDPIRNPTAFNLADNSDAENRDLAIKGSGGVLQYFPPADSSSVQPEGQAPPVPMPPGISTVQALTSERYIAHIRLFDHLGGFVKSWDQRFGYSGEIANVYRRTPAGTRSYLVWDERDSRGQLAGTGVYVWKVTFEFDGGRSETHITKTGLVRN